MFKHYKKYLPDGELNPGLPRDRRGSLPLDYQGLDKYAFPSTCLFINFLFSGLIAVQKRQEEINTKKASKNIIYCIGTLMFNFASSILFTDVIMVSFQL